MEGWSRLSRNEALQKARYRTRQPSENRKLIEEEIRYLDDNPNESTRIAKTGDQTFENWYKYQRSQLLRIAREIGIPITIRQEDGGTGLLFWKATEEELAARPNPQRRPTPQEKGLGVTEDLDAEDMEEREEDESLAFACDECDERFATQRQLSAHKRREHP